MKKVYVIAAREAKAVKIGVTEQSLEDRLSQLKTGSPHELEVIDWYETGLAREVESFIHNHIEKKDEISHKKGEWFKIEKEEIDQTLEMISKLPRRAESKEAWSRMNNAIKEALEPVNPKSPMLIVHLLMILVARAFIVDTDRITNDTEIEKPFKKEDKAVRKDLLELLDYFSDPAFDNFREDLGNYSKDARFLMNMSD